MVRTLISGDGDESFDRHEAAEFDQFVTEEDRRRFAEIIAPYAGHTVVEQAMRLPSPVRQAERIRHLPYLSPPHFLRLQ